MTAAQQRRTQRAIHLVTGVAIVAYVYAPGAAHLQNPVRFLILPLLVLTGITMWQAPRIRRLRKSLGRTPWLRVLAALPTPKARGKGLTRDA